MEVIDIINTVLRVILIFLIVFVERKKPGEAILWIAIVFVSPVIGGILYAALGSTLGIKLSYYLRSKQAHDVYLASLAEQYTQLKDGSLLESFDTEEAQLISFNLDYCDGGIGFDNKVEIFARGQDKYERMLQDIREAKHHIHFAYYGIYNDHVGQDFMEALTHKAEEGVQVKVLCDTVGSFGIVTRLFMPLIQAGGKVKTMKPLLTHFRYHRKIVVIDGHIGYTGGMNIGAKYADEHPKKTPWRDTQVRMRGDSVAMLQYYFIYDWLFASGGARFEDVFSGEAELFPPPAVDERLPCQIIGGGVETDDQPIKLSYVRMISLAKKRIVLQTPYFIPSVSLLDALKVALSSGVEVVLHTSGIKANFFLDPVSRFFMAQLVPLGLKVMQYEGYVHAKTVRIDDTITCIGSVNIDIRSLEVDDEICAFFYSKEFGERYDALLADDFAQSKEMDYEAFLDRGLGQKAAERFFLLFSPLM